MDRRDSSSRDGTIDWSLCTRDGARRAQLRAFRALNLREKLEAVEQLCDLTRRLAALRRKRGLKVLPIHEDDPATRSVRGA